MKKAFIVLLIAIVSITALVSCNPEPKENHTHDYSKEVVDAKYLKDAATCTTKAVYYKSCECGEKGTETFESGDASHSVTKTEAAAATCTAAGNNEYWTCSVCTKLFAEEECETELTAEDVTISKIAHTMTHHEAVAATCTAAGTAEYYECSECEKNYAEEQGTTELTTVDVAKTAHVDANSDGICDNCGYDAANSRIAVGTFAMFAQAFDSAVANEVTDIVLTADIAWDDEVAESIAVDASGLTIDLNGHTLSAVPGGGKFNLQGDSFTLTNGTVAGRTDGTSYAVLTINDKSSNATLAADGEDVAAVKPASYDDSDPIYKKRIVLKDLVLDYAGMRNGICFISFDNVTVNNTVPGKAVCLNGTNALINNCSFSSKETTAVYGLHVVGGGNLVTITGTNTFNGGQYGLYIQNSGNVVVAAGAEVTAEGKYVKATSTTSGTATGAIYLIDHSSLTIDGSVTAKAANSIYKNQAVVYFSGSLAKAQEGSTLTVNDGGSLRIFARDNVPCLFYNNNADGGYVLTFANGSHLYLNDEVTDHALVVTTSGTDSECYPQAKAVTDTVVLTSREGTAGARLTIYDLR
ncbi:MAG: hypothetical protein MJ057_00420 [Sphaerochaetaceae bacterium]|nr:hypothetical protein [Sphaerochaetaceae bacterium]